MTKLREISEAAIVAAERRALELESPKREAELVRLAVSRFRHRAGLHWNSLDFALIRAAHMELHDRQDADRVREAYARWAVVTEESLTCEPETRLPPSLPSSPWGRQR